MPKTSTKRESVRKGTANPQQKFQIMRDDMNALLIERDEEIDICLTGLLCKEYPLLVGPPGTAKTMLAKIIAQWFETKPFTIHLNKDTSRDAAFGPLKISKLVEDVYERHYDHGAAGAQVMIMEEVFKAGPAVLDMFLLQLSDGIYREGVTEFDCPLRFALALSNEWNPEGAEVGTAAFFDRFALRKAVRYVSKAGRERLFTSNGDEPELSSAVNEAELDAAHEAAMELEYEDSAYDAFVLILDQLNAAGIVPGDRRMKKAYKICKGYAYLCGADQVDKDHLEILKHVLWVDPTEQPRKAAEIISKIANPLASKMLDMIQQAEDIVSKSTSAIESSRRLKALREEIENLADNPKKKIALRYINSELKRLYKRELGDDTSDDE